MGKIIKINYLCLLLEHEYFSIFVMNFTVLRLLDYFTLGKILAYILLIRPATKWLFIIGG